MTLGIFFMPKQRLYIHMMKRAIRLAKRAEGKTSPNPMVGAVVFKGDTVISTGYHKQAGQPHAEINALNKAGTSARGASIAVNLEPCCHTGKTGPCTQALIDAGIKEVIYALEDPFCEVNGRSRAILEVEGITVISGICKKEARRLNEVYYHFNEIGKPFVVLKSAQTLDGRIASKTGDSKWITGPTSRAFGHKLRGRYDAVAVGSGTVRADNPRLTVRKVKGRNPYRIIVTTSGNFSKDIELIKHNDDNKTIIATTKEVLANNDFGSVTTWKIRSDKNGLILSDLQKIAGKQGITSILFEGGAQIATALFKNRLVDKYFQFVAPLILGEGISGIGNLNLPNIANAIAFNDCGFKKLGDDRLFWGYPRR